MTATCRTCQAPIVWAEHHATGRRMPLDAVDAAAFGPGAFAVLDGVAFGGADAVEDVSRNQAVSMRRAHELLEDAEWRTSHFASCAQADQHRRTR